MNTKTYKSAVFVLLSATYYVHWFHLFAFGHRLDSVMLIDSFWARNCQPEWINFRDPLYSAMPNFHGAPNFAIRQQEKKTY